MFSFLFTTTQETNTKMEEYKKVLKDIIETIKNKLETDKEKPSGSLNEENLNKYLRKQDYINNKFKIYHIRGAFGSPDETKEFKNLYNLVKNDLSLFDNTLYSP